MSKLFSLLNKIIVHELISGSIFTFIGNSASNFIAFILNLFLARNLSYADYGIFTSLLSLITLLSIPTQAFNTIILRFASKYFALNQEEYASAFYKKILKYISLVALSVFFLFVIFSEKTSEFLNIREKDLIIFSGLIVGASYLSIVNTSFLQSLLKFKLLAIIGLAGGIIKLFIGISLVLLGFRVYGGIGAILAMFLSTFLFGFIPLRRLFMERKKEIKFPLREMLLYSFPATIAVVSLFSLISSDVILVKHFFQSNEAGLYGGLSVVGRVIFFFTAPIPVVMFPLLVKRHSKKENYKNIFHLSFSMISFISFSLTIFYFIFPEFIITFFLGGKEYLKLTPYLGMYGLFISLFGILNLFVSLFLSLKKTSISYFLTVGAIFQITSIFIFHKNFYQIIGISILTCGLLIFVLLIFYLRFFQKNK